MQVEHGERDGQGKPAWAGAARVEVQNAVVSFDLWLVGVAVEDDGHAGGLRLDIEIVQSVDHVDQAAGELYGLGGREGGAGAGTVDVAANGGEGGDLAEGVEDGWVAYVAGVEDVVDAAEGHDGFGAEEAVGVGEDAYAHGPNWFRRVVSVERLW